MSYDPFAGSDDEFLKTPVPDDVPEEKKEEGTVVETPVVTPENTVEKPTEETPEALVAEQPGESANVTPEAPAGAPEQPNDQGVTPASPPPAKQPESQAEPAQAKPEQGKADQGEGKEKENKPSTTTPPEDGKYKSFYEALTGPIKGGGTTVNITSAEEAKKLIQMGLDYTRKTQAIAEDRRYLDMLGKAGLLDETKLDHLIAISKGDKTALAAFFKNSKIDPIDIDPKEGDKYQPGALVVPKQESTFKAAIADVRSEDGGNETIAEINDNWDKESKEVLYGNPAVLKQIHEYRMNGTYAKIAGEVKRLKAIGQIGADVPFVYAFKEVGMMMQKAGSSAPTPSATPKPPTAVPGRTAAPVAKRPATSTSSNVGTAAAKASATRSTPAKQTSKVIDIMGMSDDELLKLKL